MVVIYHVKPALLEKNDRKGLKTIDLESQSFPIVFLNRVYTIENDWPFAVSNRFQSCSIVLDRGGCR